MLYLEDFEVGQRFVTGEHLMTADEIKAFAADFDPQPFHLDEDAAKDSFFGGLAASGWHTAAVSMRLMVEGGARTAGGQIGAGVELAWPQATRPGDILRVEIEVLEILPSKSRPDRGLVVMRNETKNQRGEVVQRAVVKALAFRRPA
jgi:acyl dehydratase